MLEIRLLGQFDIRADEVPISIPSRPAQSLLAYLVLTAGTAHRRERLVGLLWPDADENSGRASLRQGLWRIRKALEGQLPAGEHYLLADDLTVSFNAASSYWLDVAVLDAQDNSPANLREALALYRGELLPGFYDEWVLRERERIEGVFERRMGQLVDTYIASQQWPEVLEWAERWIAVGHVPEPAYRALMLAHSQRGDRARVATVYQRCRELLFEELGAQPSEQTRQLFARLSQGESAILFGRPDSNGSRLAPEEPPPAPGTAPFQGLQPFDEQDAERFFGRERLTTQLSQRLQIESCLAVIGASGGGKSSVVRAGVVPFLRSRGWSIYVMTPTAHPLAALATGLFAGDASATKELHTDPRTLRFWFQRNLAFGQRALLVVDQFEELFTLCHDPFEREAFVDNLLAACDHGGPLNLLIALRADFYAHCAQYTELRDALAAHQAYVGPMTAEELRRAIELPAERGGWKLQPGLIDLLLRDVGDEPGALPLLSHALLETWRRRRGTTLSLLGYAESGGVRGAIAQTAETVYREQFSAQEQVIARRIFLRLTELGEGTQDTRRRVRLDELLPQSDAASKVRAVVHALADARLITIGVDTAEVAHEALIREWPTLRAWLDEDRDGLRLHRHLTESAHEWERLGRDEDGLYRGARLAQAQEWAAAHPAELIQLERLFLESSVAYAEREVAEREAQRQRELDSAHRQAEAEHQRAETARQRAEEQRLASRRLRRRAVYLTAALVLAFAMSGVATVFGDQARRAAADARSSASTAFARELAGAATNALDTDPERSILLALQAVQVARSAAPGTLREAQEALHRAIETSRVQRRFTGHSAGVYSVAFSPNGQLVASVDQDGTAKVWDAGSGAERMSLETETHGNYGNGGIAFSPDGRTLATIQRNRAVRLWDAATGSVQLELPDEAGALDPSGNAGPLLTLAFSPDGRRVATGASDGTARVWDLTSGSQLNQLQGAAGNVYALAFTPDGARLATGGYDDGTVRVWDLHSSQPLLTLSGHREPVEAIAFSPDAATIATASDDATAQLWDAATGQHRFTLYGHLSHVSGVAFDPTGNRLATASEDGYAKVWEMPSGRLLFTLSGHTSGLITAAWSPDGTQLATGSRDNTVRLWNMSTNAGSEGPILVGHTGRVFGVAFNSDGTRIATAGDDRTARIWDAFTGQQLLTLAGHTSDVQSVAFRPDGTQVATTSSDQTGRVWDATTGEGRVLLTAASGSGLGGAAWSRDGRLLALAPGDTTVGLWGAAAGAPPLTLHHTANIQQLNFSPDGGRLAAPGEGGHTLVWDVDSGTLLFDLDSRTTQANGAAFSPNGRVLATTGNDGLVRLWDAASGKELGTRGGHAGSTFGVEFNRDGSLVATSGVDRTVKIWTMAGDTLAPDEPLTLSGHTAAVYRLVWSPDGRRIATASRDGTSRVYLVNLDDLVALARSRVTRGLTVEECQKFLHQEQCPE